MFTFVSVFTSALNIILKIEIEGKRWPSLSTVVLPAFFVSKLVYQYIVIHTVASMTFDVDSFICIMQTLISSFNALVRFFQLFNKEAAMQTKVSPFVDIHVK